MPLEDTIFALSTGNGKAGVAIIRLSGPMSRKILEAMCGLMPKPRLVSFRTLKDPASGEVLDQGLVFWLKSPASFTGEEMAELQIHGAVASVEAVFAALHKTQARPAEAGEFTQRAFRNGQLDLAQAEGLADLIDSETDQQRRQALGQLGGRLSEIAQDWRQRLLDISVPLEAAIDFPDEEDIPAQIEARAKPVIEAMVAELENFLAGAERARRVREGLVVVLIGAPNVGKSTMLNFLAGSERAIVSSQPGTTRDLVEVRLDIAGMAVTIVDTAGLREQTEDAIEKEGMRRALERAEHADLRIGMVEAGGDTTSLLDRLEADDLLIINKCDKQETQNAEAKPGQYLISLKTGAGVTVFFKALEQRIIALSDTGDAPALTRMRHVEAVEKSISALKRALENMALQPDLAAEDVRYAARYLSRITGAMDVEDVLGAIFSSFCIGK